MKNLAERAVDKSPVNIVKFANATVLDELGNEIKVGTLWRNHTVLFVFLRHFGCVSCRAHAVQVWGDRANYERDGAKIVFVGNGSPHFINIFKADLKLDGAPIYTDPTLTTFQAAGFKRGFLVALGPQALINGVKLFGQGFKQGAYDKATGDLWQLGGVMVIRTDGGIAYHYISQVLGDYPPEKDIPN